MIVLAITLIQSNLPSGNQSSQLEIHSKLGSQWKNLYNSYNCSAFPIAIFDYRREASIYTHTYTGWWFQPSEKYQSIGMIIPNICKNKNPNHQPVYIYIIINIYIYVFKYIYIYHYIYILIINFHSVVIPAASFLPGSSQCRPSRKASTARGCRLG